jgi:hypothetical protein
MDDSDSPAPTPGTSAPGALIYPVALRARLDSWTPDKQHAFTAGQNCPAGVNIREDWRPPPRVGALRA